ncbi:MAG: HAD family hydrolase [Erysipelotrichaceae bacterium]|nr:HAD family hydrolase [Erysipelotrichaceae bacterium]
MIKLLASDLDGTLLTVKTFTERYINDENRQALYTLVNQGVRFVSASGRHHDYSLQLAKELGFPFDAIGGNGATIMQNGVCIRHRHVDREKITEVIDTLYQMNVWDRLAAFAINNNFEHIFAQPHQWPYDDFVEFHKKGEFGPCLEVPLNEYMHNPHSPNPTKLVLQLRPEESVEEWLTICRDRFGDWFDILSSGESFIEFLAPGVSKGDGLRYLMEEYGLNEDEVAVIGDAQNDISMFLACNHSYCMSHSLPSVQKYAGHIVSSAAEAMYDVIRKNEQERTTD